MQRADYTGRWSYHSLLHINAKTKKSFSDIIEEDFSVNKTESEKQNDLVVRPKVR
jgi:hypothetical protein